jgi:hypothetical protein
VRCGAWSIDIKVEAGHDCRYNFVGVRARHKYVDRRLPIRNPVSSYGKG